MDAFGDILSSSLQSHQCATNLYQYLQDEEYDTDAVLEDIDTESDDIKESNIYQSCNDDGLFKFLQDLILTNMRNILGVLPLFLVNFIHDFISYLCVY